MRFKTYVLMVSLILASMPAALLAGSNQWTSMGPDGASIRQIVANPADRSGAYVVTNSAGIFKTADGGASWRLVSEGLPSTNVSAVLVIPDDPATLYAASAGAIFISRDAGEHWSLQGRIDNAYIVSFAFDAASRTLYAATQNVGGVFRSLDGGKTWEQPAITLRANNMISLAVSPDGAVYAVRLRSSPTLLETLFRSSDHGETWASVVGSPAAERVAIDSESSTIYIVVGGTNVFASSNGGMSWSALPTIGDGVRITSVLPVGAGRIYVSTDHGVYQFSDRSAAWTAVGSPNVFLYALAITASPPRRLFAAKNFGLLTSVENSGAWTAADKGLPAYANDVAVVQSAPPVVYTATFPGLFKTENNGQGWQELVPGGFTLIAASPGANDTLFAVGPASLEPPSPNSLLKTTDSGATWKTVTPAFASALTVARSDSATIYAALSSGMSKSTDGGNSWKNIGAGLPVFPSYYYVEFATSVAVDPNNASRVYVAQIDGGIYSSVNGGSTWTASSPKSALALAIDPTVPSLIYAGLKAGGGVMKSVDGGVTWADSGLGGETVQTLAMDPTNSSVIYAGTSSGAVHISMNGGNNWSFFDFGLRHAPVSKLAINASGKQLYAATTAGIFGYEWDDAYLQSAVKYTVSLRTNSMNFVSAADCGASDVNANAVSAGPCETFTLYDLNGGKLMDGDAVHLRAAIGSFVSAENGGANGCGGCASPLHSDRPAARTWETFTIRRMNGPGQISSGTAVTLLSSAGNYVTAENGGANACSCDSPVVATRVVAREWETFVISIR